MTHTPLPASLSPQNGTGTKLVRAGGSLGIAGCFIGLAIFITACAGFDAVFSFSMIPLLMGVIGLVITIAGATQQRTLALEDTHVLAAFFITLIASIGGLVEVAVWRQWSIFFGQGG